MKVFKTLFAGGMVALLAACGGGGGGSTSSVVQPPVKPTPIPVQRTSYENKIAAGKALGPLPSPPTFGTMAYADFAQDGSYSVVVHSLEYDVNKPISEAKKGHIFFYKRLNGVWQDITATLLSDNSGCIHPRKALVADFNGDGRPDVFFACHGYDASPFPGEQQRLLLSQPNGTYINTLLPITAFGHGASAVDVNGGGFSDVVLTDVISGAKRKISYLINNKNGGFAVDNSRVPQSITGFTCYGDQICGYNIFSTEFIDFNKDGKYDLWVGGAFSPTDIASFKPTVFTNPGNYVFADVRGETLPTTLTNAVALDVVFENNSIYHLYVPIDYSGISMEKIDYSTKSVSSIYSHAGKYQNGSTWFDWFILYQNSIVPMNSDFPVKVPL